MLYFAYGSNMLRSRLENQRKDNKQIDRVIDRGIGILRGYKIKFNKQSIYGSGKTNLVKDGQSETLGVIYGLTDEQLKLLGEIEFGYKKSKIEVVLGNHIIPAVTYFAIPEKINDNLLPTKDYLDFLILGAEEHNFPIEYLEFLRGTKIE